MEQKLTAAIAASYFGADVICAPYGGQPNRKITGTMIGLNNHGIDIKFPEWQSPHQIATDQCQLILTPLSKISDEDAVEVAKIIMPFCFTNRKNGWKVTRDYAVTGYPYIKIHHPKKVCLFR